MTVISKSMRRMTFFLGAHAGRKSLFEGRMGPLSALHCEKRSLRTVVAFMLIASAFDVPHDASSAESSVGLPRVGLLRINRREVAPFVQGLKELNYVDGKNIQLDYRYADETRDNVESVAAELVRLKVAMIVANGPTAINPALKATKTVPIVMIGGGEPTRRGFVESLSRPGGNVTGLASSVEGLSGKRLQLLQETLPKMSRVAVLNADVTRRNEEYEVAAISLGLKLQAIPVNGPRDFDRVFAEIIAVRPDALIVVRNTFTIRSAEEIASFALKNRIPAMYESEQFVKAGGLISYGVNYLALWKRAATFVDKILKGASPATLPIEPPEIELSVNLRAANMLGIKIPPEILLEANEVIR